MTRDLILMDCPKHGRVPHDTKLELRSFWECSLCTDEEFAAEREWLDAQDRLNVGWSVPDEDPLIVQRWWDDLEAADRARVRAESR